MKSLLNQRRGRGIAGGNGPKRQADRSGGRLSRIVLGTLLIGLFSAGPRVVQAQLSISTAIEDSIGVRPGSSDVTKPTLEATLSPADAQAGDEVTLSLHLRLPPRAATYSQDPSFQRPVEISIAESGGLEPVDDGYTPDHPPKRTYDRQFKKELAKFTGEVTWTRRFRLLADSDPASVFLRGEFGHLVCDDKSCRPYTHEIAVSLTGSELPAEGTGDNRAADAGAEEAAETPTSDQSEVVSISEFELLEAAPPSNLAMNLIFAFLGGLILNVMPCVLPVIAIKVLSFVQQAGESRSRILALNGVYSLGVIAVFLTLAALAVFLGKGWGSLFQDDYFNLFMAAVVFAMGLSLLGVFEIPVPGMVGSAGGVTQKEGLPGAFLTGIFATLLATPCTGPFMGTTLAWSLDQPTGTVFLIWGVMGLGMASPYLVLGAFPQLVHWLPQPGMWMVRFKEFAGFVLMGAVIWILTFINRDLIVPTLVMLAGISLGLWMIGNLYDHSTSARTKWQVRGAALVLTLGICGIGYWMQAATDHLPWQKFSTAKVEELRSEGKPILIDFTADWCNICKTNEALALNRQGTISFVEKHGIVPLMADYTDLDPEITKWLDVCNQEGVPLTLIFPAGRPNEAIPLRGPYSQGTLIRKLKQAVAENPESSNEQALAGDAQRTTSEARQPATPAGAGIVR